MIRPSAEVLDLFAVPDDVEPLPGGRGDSVCAGDLVLSPGRDPDTALWLNPVLARLAVRLDEDPRRPHRGLRVAMPVPSRDGRWVVDGWGASRYERGTVVCHDLDVTLAAGRLLHAELASAVPERPEALVALDDAGQLVDTALAGHVLLDADGAPVVLDVVPAWAPALWAEALAVLDAVTAGDAPSTVLRRWATGREGDAMQRAAAHRSATTPST